MVCGDLVNGAVGVVASDDCDSGCAGVASACVAMPRFAHLARKIIRISFVFEWGKGLLR
jgi:hypothetical protein